MYHYRPRIVNSAKAASIGSFFPRDKLPVITAELLQQQQQQDKQKIQVFQFNLVMLLFTAV